MKMEVIKYRSGYKYQLAADVLVFIGFGLNFTFDYFELRDGCLTIRKGYAWDGATDFPDLKSIMRGSLVHDALYQAMRLGMLPLQYRVDADLTLSRMCREDGMIPWLDRLVLMGVRWGASGAALPSAERVVEEAP